MSKPDSEVDEPTIDWLIDQIAPNEGNSPLLNFNKERLKKLLHTKTVEALERVLAQQGRPYIYIDGKKHLLNDKVVPVSVIEAELQELKETT